MMIGESAFRPYYKPVVAHTSHGYDQAMNQRNLYSSPEPMMSSSPGKAEKGRRRRTTFTPEQTATLEREYITDRYMDSGKRAAVAEMLQLQEIQVKTWFQNRRAKDKKDGKAHTDSPRVPVPRKDEVPAEHQQNMLYHQQQEMAHQHQLPLETHQVDECQVTQEQPSVESPPQKSVSPVDKKLLFEHPALKAALDSPVMTPRSSPPVEETSPVWKEDKSPTPVAPAVAQEPVPQPAAVAPSVVAPPPTSYADYLGLNPIHNIAMPTPVAYNNSIYDIYGGAAAAVNANNVLVGKPATDYNNFMQSANLFTALSSFDPQALMGMQQQSLANL